jgi:genome maintenance exonuclease 1
MDTEKEKLESVEADGKGRYYRSPTSGSWYPSVTTVVNHRDAEKWAEWRKNPDNAKVSQAAIERGNRLHRVVEDWLMLGKTPTTLDERWHFDPLLPYLKRIGRIYAIEKSLWSDVMMLAGRTDCIGDYDRCPSIIDFKTSGKPKRREWITNYFHQAAAYSYMWEERTGEKIETLVVLIACDDGSVQEFVEDRIDHREGLSKVIEDYWKKYDFTEVQGVANRIREVANEVAP